MLGAFGEPSHGKDPKQLAKDFFSMSNDSFFILHGFNWVPPEPLYSIVKQQLDKEFEDSCLIGGGLKSL